MSGYYHELWIFGDGSTGVSLMNIPVYRGDEKANLVKACFSDSNSNCNFGSDPDPVYPIIPVTT